MGLAPPSLRQEIGEQAIDTERENAILTIVEKQGMVYTIIGLVLWSSHFVYAVVIFAMVLINAPAEASSSPVEIDFFRLLALVLLVMSPFMILIAFWVRRFLGKRTPRTITPMLKFQLARLDLDIERHHDLACGTQGYAQSALISSAVAMSPGIYALTMALLLLQTSSLTNDLIALSAVVCMWLLSTIFTFFLVPSKSGLDTHLRQLTVKPPSDSIPNA